MSEQEFPGLHNDLRLVVMAAHAFNMGFPAREDRETEDIQRLREACLSVGEICGLVLQ